MKFLVFTSDYKPRAGGIAQHCYNVARGLENHGDEALVLTVKKPGWRDFDRLQTFKTRRIADVPCLRNIVFMFCIVRLYIKHRFDFIYSGITRPCAELSFLVSLLLPVKSVIAVHGYEVAFSDTTVRGKIKYALRFVRTFVYNHSYKIIAVSNYTKQKLVESGVRPEKIEVVPNGVDTTVFHPGEKHTAIIDKHNLGARKIILTVGTLTERKGHELVIKALPEVLQHIPDAVYLVPGAGAKERELKNLAAKLNLQDRVIFLGYVPKEDLIKLYNTCDVFVMVSKISGSSVEGFGIVYLEANACGKPVLAGRLGGVVDAVVDGETGVLVNPENPKEVAAGLIKLLKDQALARRLGRKGHARVQNEFSRDRLVSGMVENLKVMS